MLVTEQGAFAEAGHVATQVVDPDVFGAIFLLLRLISGAFGEEQHVGLDTLRIEDAGRQAQDGVPVALVHQVTADISTDTGLEQHGDREHHSGAATGF